MVGYRERKERAMLIRIRKGRSRGRPARPIEHLPDSAWRDVSRRRLNSAVCRGDIPRAATRWCFLCSRQATAYHHNRAFPFKSGYQAQPVCGRCLLDISMNLHR